MQADPAAAGSLVKALQRSAASSIGSTKRSKSLSATSPAALAAAAGLFKWELTMHVGINTGSTQRCSQVTIPTRPDYRLLAHSGTMSNVHTLLLALSPKPLGLGLVQAEQVKQLCLGGRACCGDSPAAGGSAGDQPGMGQVHHPVCFE